MKLLAATLISLATAASACSPLRDPELLHGYLPPVPCWLMNDPACRPYLRDGTQLTLDADHGLAIVYGVSESCAADITEEIARSSDERKEYGWLESIGTLTLIDGDILVISGMDEETVEEYSNLKYYETGDWSR